MLLQSDYQPLASVRLPFAGRQKYMHGFDCAAPVMPEGFEDYLEPVLTLLDAAGVREGKAWMTVDEKVVKAGESQRRPGPHVDGKFNMKAVRWGGGGGGGWNHSCNLVPVSRTPVIVAASAVGCRAWRIRTVIDYPSPVGQYPHALCLTAAAKARRKPD